MPNTPAPAVPVPTAIKAGSTPADTLRNLRVVDAKTGEPIERVLEADSTTGKLVRHQVKDGNLVREGDAFALVTEERAIRLEWIDPPVPASEPAADDEAQG